MTFTTADGYEANDVLKTYPIRLFIIDRLLPPWPGLDMLRQLRVETPALRIAFIDGGSRGAAILARICGAHVVLTKPLTCNQVLAALGEAEVVF